MNLKVKIKRLIMGGLYFISPVLATKVIYKRTFKRKLNLNNPVTFNEKIQWLKLFWQHPLVSQCGDKYAVREYVARCGCENILNEIYGVYTKVDEIDYSIFPNKFVIKGTHGCGFNIICNDKTS